MLPVVHVVSVVDVVDIDVVSPVPGGRPCFRAGIDDAEPVSTELETGIAFDYDDRNLMDAEPVSAAEMGAEAIVGNAIPVVSATIVPATMLSVPVMRALAFPDILPNVTRSRLVPSDLAIFHRAVGAVNVALGSPLIGLMGFARLLVMMFRAIAPVAVLRLRWVRAFVSLSVRAAVFMTSGPAVLSAGKPCCSQ
jgi:hypothetical protein